MPIVTTDFVTDGEGWTIKQNLALAEEGVTAGGPLVYQSTGGNSPSEPNPDGTLEYTDSIGGTAFFSAPDDYLGDHSGKFHGSINYSLYITDTGSKGLDNDISTDIIVSGTNGVTITYDIPTPTATDTWVDISVDFDDGNWINQATGQPATEAEIKSVLADVGEFLIAGEYSTVDGDVTHLDTVSFVCFASGTKIKTSTGETTVERLQVGDLIPVRDGNTKPIRWIGSRKITSSGLMANPKLRPVRIKAGALGSNLPSEDLIVSRQHRVLIKSVIAERVFGVDEVLVPAIKLVSLEGIEVADDLQEVEYFHILFDQHQIIYSNGAPTESLFTGPEALKAISPEACTEITALFPEIVKPEFNPHPAALIPRRTKKVNHLVQRHSKNKKPLLAGI